MKDIKVTRTLPVNYPADAVCKICLDGSFFLLSPCKCSGSLKYIHEDCLKTWILAKYSKIEGAKCEICSFQYKMQSKTSRVLICRRDLFLNVSRCVICPLLLTITGLMCYVMYLLIMRYVNSFDVLSLLLALLCGAACVIVFVLFGVFFLQLCTRRQLKKWNILNYEGQEEHANESTFIDNWKPLPTANLVAPDEVDLSGRSVSVQIHPSSLSRIQSVPRFSSLSYLSGQSRQLRSNSSANQLHWHNPVV